MPSPSTMNLSNVSVITATILRHSGNGTYGLLLAHPTEDSPPVSRTNFIASLYEQPGTALDTRHRPLAKTHPELGGGGAQL